MRMLVFENKKHLKEGGEGGGGRSRVRISVKLS